MYIIRHPETEFNKKGIIQGHSDSPLTIKGEKVAHKLGKKLKELGIDKIYSSDLGRCKETAQIINQYLNVEIHYRKGLRERNYGIFNNKSLIEVAKKIDLYDENLVIKDGESIVETIDRIMKLLKWINLKLINKLTGNILAVTHSACMCGVIAKIKGLEYNYKRDIVPSTTILETDLKNIKYIES